MDKTDKFKWSVGDKQVYPIDYTQEELRQVYPIDYTQEEPHEADTQKKEISTQKIKNYIREQLWYKIFWGKISYVNGKTPGKNEKLVFRLKELDSALILQTMVSLAKTLDDAIVQLKHPKEKRTETDVIDDLLRDLMRFREKRKGHAGPYVICSP